MALAEAEHRRHFPGASRQPAANIANGTGSPARRCRAMAPSRGSGTGAAPILVQARDRFQQAARIGMARPAENRAHVAVLDDTTGIHDDHPFADVGNDAEIVRDQEDRRVRRWREPASSVRAPAPGSSRRARSSARRRSAAWGCMRAPSRSSRAGASRPRTGADRRRPGPPDRECRQGSASRATRRRRASRVERGVKHDGFADLVADGHQGVERAHRLLEDHRDVAPADIAASALRGRSRRLTPLNSIRPCTIRPGGSGISRRIDSDVIDLPEPGFADDADRAAGRRSRSSTPSTARIGIGRAAELDREILDLQQRCASSTRSPDRGRRAPRRRSG